MSILSGCLLVVASKIVNDGRGLGAETHLAGVIAIGLKISPELLILPGHPIGRQGLDEEESNCSRKQGQAAPDPERTSVSANGIGTAESLDDRRESPSSDECSDLSGSSGDAVVLAADGGRTTLGSQETQVVSRSELSEGKKDSVDDGEGGDVFGQFGIETAHDESNDRLGNQTEDHGVFWSKRVDDEGATDGSREVKGTIERYSKYAD